MPGTAQSLVHSFKEARRRSGYFVLSLLCGIGIPLSTLGAELLVKGKIDDVSWYSAGVTYVAAIGLASKSGQVLLLMLVGAGALAFLYGVDLMADVVGHQRLFSAYSAQIGAFMASLAYFCERVGLHLFDTRPFPE